MLPNQGQGDMMNTYNMQSSGLLHAPGIVRWAMAGYRTGDAKKMVSLICSGWNLPSRAAEALLSGKVPWTEKDGTVVFSI